MWKEFKQFAMNGNMFDLAIAVIIGSDFSKSVEPLVKNIMMPLLGVIIGGVQIERLYIPICAHQILMGLILHAILDFLIVSSTIFWVVKLINRLRGHKEAYELKVRQTLHS
ncbi:large conductance mechanosensitive channel protein MscL [Bacillus sp. 2205SS5-2]|uniref:large conductance mechanosensitive channel protein MscL n=1 Tax=Bacillus sp. 2205SS5-2 TaxID=3109031 RepID=UPI003007B85B